MEKTSVTNGHKVLELEDSREIVFQKLKIHVKLFSKLKIENCAIRKTKVTHGHKTFRSNKQDAILNFSTVLEGIDFFERFQGLFS